MKTRDDVIKALGGLTRSDREWIIRRLPQTTRFALLLGTQNQTSSPSVGVSNSENASKSTDPRVMISVLEREPAWVAHAVLSVSNLWAAEVRQGLSQGLRQQLDILDRASVSYSPRVIESVERQLSLVAKKVIVDAEPSDGRNVFAQIGARLSKARMNRRIAT